MSDAKMDSNDTSTHQCCGFAMKRLVRGIGTGLLAAIGVYLFIIGLRFVALNIIAGSLIENFLGR